MLTKIDLIKKKVEGKVYFQEILSGNVVSGKSPPGIYSLTPQWAYYMLFSDKRDSLSIKNFYYFEVLDKITTIFL
jgi:hypothetical protein